MHFLRKYTLVLAGMLMAGSSAYAQVCMESSGNNSGKVNLTCSMAYRDATITCDPKGDERQGTFAPCPPKPMPMLDTPLKAYMRNYSEYLYTFPRDPKDSTRPYVGAYATGTAGDATQVMQMFGKPPVGVKPLATCRVLLQTPDPIDPTNLTEQGRANRLVMDGCSNEYILNWALSPFQESLSNAPAGDDRANPGKLVDMESVCQPLKLHQPKDNEYQPLDYILTAWRKTLTDPGYRKTTLSQLKYVPCINSSLLSDVPCDREPHLPKDVKIATLDGKPILPSSEPFKTYYEKWVKGEAAEAPELTIGQLGATDYEKINDPTHPFSPRWDYLLNDREYANPSLSWGGASGMAKILTHYGLMKLYMEDTKDAVFCAGVKKTNNSGAGGISSGQDKQKEKDSTVPVDVMEFRRPAFEKALFGRVEYNAACYAHKDLYGESEMPLFMVLPEAYCFEITKVVPYPPYVYAKGYNCWKCFGLSGKISSNQAPPCTTDYRGKDLYMKHLPGLLNHFSFQAQCNGPLGARNPSHDMDKVCKDLRKPVTMINRLKMRYYNPDEKEKDYNSMPAGVGEGLSFKEYFGNHMPYPRLWDTGTSLQETPTNDENLQPELDTTGQYTVIVGVGREAASKAASDAAPADENGVAAKDKYTDQRCKTMGWGDPLSINVPKIPGAPALNLSNPLTGSGVVPVSFGGTKVYVPDPLTSWAELKLYQARTARNKGVNCLGRYEKVFKQGSAEGLILSATGADWSRLVISKCNRKPGGLVDDNCEPMTLKQYIDEGSKENDSSTIYIKQPKNEAVTEPWRGYLASSLDDSTSNAIGGALGGVGSALGGNDKKNKFPDFGANSASNSGGIGGAVSSVGNSLGLSSGVKVKGLDNAEQGDVVMMPNGPSDSTTKPGLAKLALVIEVNTPKSNPNCTAKKNCYIKVFEPDNGKFPDVCGTTDTWGEMKTRYYYKDETSLPDAAKKTYDDVIHSTTSCEETRIAHCVMTSWNKLTLYKIRKDSRQGCDKKSANDCH